MPIYQLGPADYKHDILLIILNVFDEFLKVIIVYYKMWSFTFCAPRIIPAHRLFAINTIGTKFQIPSSPTILSLSHKL